MLPEDAVTITVLFVPSSLGICGTFVQFAGAKAGLCCKPKPVDGDGQERVTFVPDGAMRKTTGASPSRSTNASRPWVKVKRLPLAVLNRKSETDKVAVTQSVTAKNTARSLLLANRPSSSRHRLSTSRSSVRNWHSTSVRTIRWKRFPCCGHILAYPNLVHPRVF